MTRLNLYEYKAKLNNNEELKKVQYQGQKKLN